MSFIKKYIKIIGLVGCVILIISNFLPFITAKATVGGVSDSESISLMTEEIRVVGIIAIVIEVILTLLVATNKRKLALIPNIIMIIFAIGCIASFKGESIDLGIATGSIKYGIGFFAIIVGCILCLAFSFIKGETSAKPATETK